MQAIEESHEIIVTSGELPGGNGLESSVLEPFGRGSLTSMYDAGVMEIKPEISYL